jgi:hypothetical protein
MCNELMIHKKHHEKQDRGSTIAACDVKQTSTIGPSLCPCTTPSERNPKPGLCLLNQNITAPQIAPDWTPSYPIRI